MSRIALIVLALALAHASSHAQDEPPGCNRQSLETRCLVYYGSITKSRSESGNVGGRQRQNPERTDKTAYAVFVHAAKRADPFVDRVVKALSEQNYTVRGIDEVTNVIGGPGVDYFRDEDRRAAEGIADLITATIGDDGQRLSARKQNIVNPPGFIGVWLPSSRSQPPPDGSVEGWYYLGKVSKDKRTWLMSSALGTLTFDPPIAAGADIVGELMAKKRDVTASGYKYLRSLDGTTGRRVESRIAATLNPGVWLEILEIDAQGVDPADNETVLWAKARVLLRGRAQRN